MGWFVGPINGIPAIHHQGETFNFHANAVLVPRSRTGVIVLINAENSVDLFLSGRMGGISEGVASLLEGRDPAPPPSNRITFVLWALLFGVVAASAPWRRALDRGSATRPPSSWSRASATADRAQARLQPRLGGPRPGPRAEAARAVTVRRRSGAARSHGRPSAQRTGCALLGAPPHDLGVRDAPKGCPQSRRFPNRNDRRCRDSVMSTVDPRLQGQAVGRPRVRKHGPPRRRTLSGRGRSRRPPYRRRRPARRRRASPFVAEPEQSDDPQLGPGALIETRGEGSGERTLAQATVGI